MIDWLIFLKYILCFKGTYKFRLQALSPAHTEDAGEPKFGK